MNEPKGYWSSVFYQATVLMKSRPQMGGEAAFWMARGIVDSNIDSSRAQAPLLFRRPRGESREALALVP
jgi:hypothetical protein